ncbi:MAG: ribonuclease HI family protein [Parcubacteria group bacterium]
MKKVTIYTDGGSRGNPGPSAIGIVFYNEKGEAFKKYSEFVGQTTNNHAEYQAVIFALKKFKALFGKKIAEGAEIEVKSDSELLVRQLNGQYKIFEEKIGKLFLEIWNLKIDFKKIKFVLVSREKNKEADRLVNECLNNQARNQALI